MKSIHRQFRFTILLLIISMISQSSYALVRDTLNANQQRTSNISGTPKILCLISHKFGANIHFNLDNMRNFGWDITLAGLTDTVQPCPWSYDYGNLPLAVDTLITDIMNILAWDAVAIMPANWWSPGGAYVDLMNDQHTLDLISEAASNGKIVWATCAGVRVLAAADVINGKNVTGRINFQNEYIAAGANYLGPDILPVIDGHIVTSTKGMYYNTELIEALSTAMENMAECSVQTAGHNILPALQVHDVNLYNDNVLWSKTYGTTASEGAASISGCPGGNVMISGFIYTDEFMSDAMNLWLDENGNPGIFNAGGGANNEFVHDNFVLPDGSAITTGYTASFGSGQKDMEINKIDEQGAMSWFATFGGEGIDVATSICQLSDGNLLLCGYTESYGAGENDVYLVKTLPNGQMIWEKTYGGAQAERGLKAIEATDGNYIIIGETGSYGAGKKDVWLIKVDQQGEMIWSNTFGTQDYQTGHDVIETSDNHLMIVGSSDIHDDDFLNIYVIKTTFEGDLVWEKQYGCPLDFYENGTSITEAGEGCFLITSTVNNALTRCNDAYIFLIDSEGDVLWSETLGGEGHDRLVDAALTDDNCFVLTGQTNSWGEGHFDMWAVKLSNPMLNIHEKENSANGFNLMVSPRIFKTQTSIGFEARNPTEVEIVDIKGIRVFDFGTFSQGCHHITWNGQNNSGQIMLPGMYFITAKDETGLLQTSKLVMVK